MFGFRRKRPILLPAPFGRRALVARAKRLSGGDPAFQALCAAGEQARRRGEWAAATAAYRQAAALYPLCAEVWGQLGYVAKEQAQFVAAEVAYRTALALGARDPAPLAWVVERGGGVLDRAWVVQVAAYWQGTDGDLFATPPTRDDVADAIELLCDRGDPDPVEIRDLMEASPTRRALLAKIMQTGEFRHYHRDLLKLIAETGWGG